MDLQQIKYFLELAKELHFWKTAEKMFITQSALSRQIKALEDELELKLFERTKRNVKLTEAGKFLAEKWGNIILEINSINRHAKQIDGGKYGTIKVGYPGSIVYGFLPELLSKMQVELPELQVELFEPVDVTFEQLLLNYQMDVGFRRQAAENPTLQSLCLYSENFTLAVPENHYLNKVDFSNFQALKHEKFILSGLNQKTFYVDSLHAIFKSFDFTPDVYIESDFGSTILSLVAKGLGVSVLPGSYAYSTFPGVRFISIPHEISLFVTWRKEDSNPVLKNVLKLAQNTAKLYTPNP